MIISHKHKFVFIKGKKVAGTSIEIALSSICGDDDIITPITPIDELLRISHGVCCQNFGCNEQELTEYIQSLKQGQTRKTIPCGSYFNHMSFEHVLKNIKTDLDDYLYIVAERNPYSKVASGAVFKHLFRQYKATGSLEGDDTTYRQAVDNFFENKQYMLPYNFDLYCMEVREPDFIIKFETLEKDFSLLMNRLGLTPRLELPHTKKGGCFTPELACTFLGEKNIATITDAFQKEFKYFGYTCL